MRAYRLSRFGLDHLHLKSSPPPTPGHGEVLIQVKAISLNHRDLMVIDGRYHPKLPLPAVPISDGAGVIAAVGSDVDRVAVGDRIVTHFVADWIDGPFCGRYVKTSLGTPGAGLAAEQVVLPAQAVLPIPDDYSFAQAATLPIAALTAWSALITEGGLQAGQTVLTLGTGGVSLFALQLAKAMGARVIITSSSDEKLVRASRLGADETINYQTTPEWDRVVLDRWRRRGCRGRDGWLRNARTLTASHTPGRHGRIPRGHHRATEYARCRPHPNETPSCGWDLRGFEAEFREPEPVPDGPSDQAGHRPHVLLRATLGCSAVYASGSSLRQDRGRVLNHSRIRCRGRRNTHVARTRMGTREYCPWLAIQPS